MYRVRKASERGGGQHGWLETRHTFSFADYHDPAHLHFRALRVLNEDRVAPGTGFGMHPHRDMEIITYVLSGTLEHRDSLGNGEFLRAGELQHMSAGTGILHSEFNPDPSIPVHLYQVWLLPRQRGLRPGYEQRRFDPAGRQGVWQLVAAPDGADGALPLEQDARVYLAELAPAQTLSHALAPGRHAWLQVLRGAVAVSGQPLSAGDGLAVSEEPGMEIRAAEAAEVMLFDLA